MSQSLANKIYEAALSSGFESCGIIPVSHMASFAECFKERTDKVASAAAFYGGMADFGDVKKRFSWAESLIVCTYWYGQFRYPKQLMGHYAKDYFLKPEPGSAQGYSSDLFEGELEKLGLCFAGGTQFMHTSVGPLRHAAMMAGLGIIRKNNFFYTHKGSHYRLVGYVIDKPCELIHTHDLKPCSDECSLCANACKTGSLCGPYCMDPFKCVSFCTSFGKGVVPPGLSEDMFEEWICGCDNCQDACPYNRTHNWAEGEKFSDLEELADELTPENLLLKSDEYLTQHVIAKTDNHMRSSDTQVLRINAERAIRNRKHQL